MIEAVMIWNEPNNKSHWDLEADPDWRIFATMAKLAGQAIAAEAPRLPRVLGGMSPIDPDFIKLLSSYGTLEDMDAVAVHGFPLDWNHWQIDEWPDKLKLIAGATHLPVWVSEVGVSTFGAEEVQAWGLGEAGSCCPDARRESIGTACMICRQRGRRQRATGKPRGRRIIGISIWDCWTSMADRSRRRRCFTSSPRKSGCASGFISRTIGSMMLSAG